MRKQELDAVISVVKELEMRPFEFRIENTEELTDIIFVQEKRLVFQFERHPHLFTEFTLQRTLYRPHFPLATMKDKYRHLHDANGQFRKWLVEEVKEYIKEQNTPDPIQQWINEFNSTFSKIEGDELEIFSPDEKILVKNAFDRFEKLLIASGNVNADVLISIQKEIAYVKESVEKQNKRDFKTIANKSFYDIGISIAANVVVEVARSTVIAILIPHSYWELVFESFKALYFLTTGGK